MAPSRRSISNGNISAPQIATNAHNDIQKQPKVPRHRPQPSVTPSQPEQPNLGMSPASRYNHNLKVLRRRDPSIVSIFDQFSHVCVYHHNGKKWEKQGFEGSMFLYERESYPPYGFYILNRMGMDDYIHRLYPENDIGAHGSYLMLRSYPDFTARRVALAQSTTVNDNAHKFSDAWAVPNLENLAVKDKGRSQTVGLWMFATDAREPMIDVMIRLHSYIKKNVPYPEEFRYGPDRPPPPNPHLRTTSPPNDDSASISAQSDSRSEISQNPNSNLPSHSHSEGGQGHFTANHPSQAYTNGGVSELDKLFMKLGPTPVLSAAVPSTHSLQPNSTSKMTVESLFAALSGTDMPANDKDAPPQSASSTSSYASSGLTLLDSIFASANNVNGSASLNTNPIIFPPSAPHSRPPTTQPPPQPETIMIYSPTPTAKALPQILTQDVISSLLGLPPSRTPSAASTVASTTYSSGRRSHTSSREGDNEDDGDSVGRSRAGGSDGGYSESSTVLDPDAEFNEELQAAGASAGVPLMSIANGHTGRYDERRINGDVTPRAPMNGINGFASRTYTPPLARNNSSSKLTNTPGIVRVGIAPSALEHTLSSSTIRGSSHPPPRSQSRQSETGSQTHSKAAPNGTRPLVPFEADSELWPYPRAPLDDRSQDVDEDDDIVELDFADTSALSDPDAFRRVQKGRRHEKNGSSVDGNLNGNGRDRNTKGKMGKKERAANREREREEIERSWDVPASSAQVSRAALTMSPPASPSPVPSPTTSTPPVAHKLPEVKPPMATKVENQRTVNGASLSPEKKQKMKVNGTHTLVDPAKVRESVISAVSAQAQKPGRLERNEFVRELLTLIHTDKDFVDRLWQDYLSRLG